MSPLVIARKKLDAHSQDIPSSRSGSILTIGTSLLVRRDYLLNSCRITRQVVTSEAATFKSRFTKMSQSEIAAAVVRSDQVNEVEELSARRPFATPRRNKGRLNLRTVHLAPEVDRISGSNALSDGELHSAVTYRSTMG